MPTVLNKITVSACLNFTFSVLCVQYACNIYTNHDIFALFPLHADPAAYGKKEDIL